MRNSRRAPLAALHLGFVITGAGTALLGPALPAISERLHLSDAQSGRLFTAQFLGSFVLALASSAMIRALGTKGAVICAFAAMATGFGAAQIASWPLLLFCVVLYGAGIGLSNPATTLAAAALSPKRSAVVINSVNFAWCAGALAAPALVPLLRAPFATAAALAAVIAIAAAATLHADDRIQNGGVYRPQPVMAALTSALLFLYVGTETTLAGWTPTWASRMGAPEDMVGVPAGCFWAGILVSRLLAGLVLRSVPASTAILTGLALNAAATAAMLAFDSLPALIAGTAAAGLGLGIVFPTAVAMFCDAAGPGAVRSANFLFASGALGGAVVPLATGWLVSRFADLRAGLVLAGACTLGMIVLEMLIRNDQTN